MDTLPYETIVAAEGSALADTAAGHLDRQVPACPEWTVARLVAHLGGVYAWTRSIVAAGGERVSRRDVQAPETAYQGGSPSFEPIPQTAERITNGSARDVSPWKT